MEGTPARLDAEEVRFALGKVEGVEDVHDLHIWTIASGFESLSVHALVRGREHQAVLEGVREVARERFGIEHSTVQLESPRGEERCVNH